MGEYLGQYNWIRPSWFEEGYKKGYQQGLQQGLQQSLKRETEFVLRLIKKKFGNLRKIIENRILALPIEKIEELGEAIFDFESTKDLESWLNSASQTN